MAEKVHRWTGDKRPAVESALRSSETRAEAAERLGISVASLDFACRSFDLAPRDFLGRGEAVDVTKPAPPGLTLDELLEERRTRFARRAEHEEGRNLIPITLKSSLPIGVLHFGDPHIDDDGTNIALLEEHAKLVRSTPGLYGANVGDTTNNWIGRLARLYSQQSTTQAEAWMLAEWFVKEVRDWLYLVGGNHDMWSGAGDPLNWIIGQVGALYQDSEVRVALRFPGDREVRINCRHDFAGKSQYNPAHGPMKALFFGVRDHIAIAGHTHESAYGVLKDPHSGMAMHAIKVASYKVFDRYARDKGLRDQNLSPCAVTVIDPRLPPNHPGLVKIFWDAQEGADYLRWARSRREARA